MEAVAYSTFRKDLRAYLDKTRDDATPLLVTSKDPSANVVVMNAMDYDKPGSPIECATDEQD